jgi:hypothetical protein
LPKLTTYEGIDIHVAQEDGQFWAQIGKNVVSRGKLADLKRLIAARSRGAIVLEVGDASSYPYSRRAAAVEVVAVEQKGSGYERTTGYRTKDGDLLEGYQHTFYRHDPEALARLGALQQEYAAAEAEHDAFVRDWRGRWHDEREALGRLTPDEIKALVAEARARPEESQP